MSDRPLPSSPPRRAPLRPRIHRRHAVLAALALGLAAPGCHCDGETGDSGGTAGTGGTGAAGAGGAGGGAGAAVVEPAPASVLLEVVDGAGAPVPLAAVTAQGVTRPADGAGRLLLEGLPAGRFVARVEAPGLAGASAVVELPADGHAGATAQLAPLGAAVPFDAAAGAVFDQGPIHLVLPPGALVDRDGAPVTGTAQATFVSPDPLVTTPQPGPGPLEAMSPDGAVFPLAGAFPVDIAFWQDGERLALAGGASATLEITLPDALAAKHAAGDVLGSYSFDLTAGAWKEEGMGSVQPSAVEPGKLVWSAEIGHLSWWTVGEPRGSVACVGVTVIDGGTGLPVADVPLKVFVWDGLLVSPLKLSDDSGPVYFNVPAGGAGQLYVGAPTPIVPPVWLSGGGGGACTPIVVTLPALVCTPGSYVPCSYGGPAGTEGVGVCQAGRDYCNATGTGWLSCAGQVVPSAESCDVPFDEDCDGQANEEGAGCACVPGSTEPCYSGPAATLDVGTCKAGAHTCAPDGKGYGACAGEVLPQPETCATPEDDDCNGSPACPAPSTCSLAWNASEISYGTAVTVDGAGDVIAVGGFSGTADFGGGPVSVASRSLFVVKLDAACNHVWTRTFEPAVISYPAAMDVAADASGNILVTGYFGGTIDFGDGPKTVIGNGDTDIFLLKLDADGNTLWSKQFGDELGDQFGWGVAADASGNVFLTGNLPGSADFGGGPIPGIGYLVKLDPSGGYLWGRGFDWARGRGIAVDPSSGDVVVSGRLEGTADFGGGPLAAAGGDADVYVARYDAAGGHLWSHAFSATGLVWGGDGVAIDPSGDVIVTGAFTGSIDLGGGALASAGGQDIFVAKLTGGGAHVWSGRSGNTTTMQGPNLAVGALGDIFLAGAFSGSIELGGGPLPSAGGQDLFLAKLGPSGAPSWAARFGDTADQGAIDIAIDPAGGMVATGSFAGTLDLGGGPLNATGLSTAFLARFGP